MREQAPSLQTNFDHPDSNHEQVGGSVVVTQEVLQNLKERNRNQDVTIEQAQFIMSGILQPDEVDAMLELFRSLQQQDETDLRMSLSTKAENGSKPAQRKLALLSKWESRATIADDIRDERYIETAKVQRKMDLGGHNRYGREPDWRN